MINIKLFGGLGNNLFQYALARHLAIKNQSGMRFITEKVFRQPEKKALKAFGLTQLNTQSIKRFKLEQKLSSQRSQNFIESQFGFQSEALDLKDNCYLEGYFQSERFFIDIADQIRADLTFNEDFFDAKCHQIKNEILQSDLAVSLHVRRGDYLRVPLLNICTQDYFRRAIDWYEDQYDKPTFFVFSDDPQWCRENLNAANLRFVDLKQARKHAAIDMHLMSLCHHHIIPNSTFSWWGAWLNSRADKIVVAPNHWFADEKMDEAAMRDTVPENWVRIEI